MRLKSGRGGLGIALGCATLILLTLSACDSAHDKPTADPPEVAPRSPSPTRKLTFGVYTSDSATEMVKQFTPILNVLDGVLSRHLGQPVEITLKVASTYEGGVQDLLSGRVDFARMGPASYVQAKKANQGIRILAIESKKGSKLFLGIICVHQDSGIKDLIGLKGKRFAFGDSRSTIGRFLAQEKLVERGIYGRDLAGFDYLGRHDKVGMAVGRNRYAAGALKQSTFKKLVKAGEPIRALVSFPNVTKPWIARVGLEPKLFKAIQQALLGLDDAKALKALKKDGFLPGDDTDYEPIRKAIKASRSFDS